MSGTLEAIMKKWYDEEYEFTIDANTGEILEWDMDSVYD